ncbi:MAG: hypothetical protein SFV52_04500 [Saprospiraceae bacterium]|nr:hypothetical protein [Saprospiraceae bacterium]
MPHLLLIAGWLWAQQPSPIPFFNPSFEDEPRASASPAGWTSYTPGSTPDIFPGAWGLQAPAADGKTCLGLVTRTDGSTEDVSQNLQQPLQAGVCYKFSIRLAHLPQYVGYNQAVRLRIWGGTEGRRTELLAGSPLIHHPDWREYTFEFIPDQEVRCITFEAYFGPGVMFRYKGNILLDLVSPIIRCDRA